MLTWQKLGTSDCDCVRVCDMLMLILGTCWTTFVFMWKLKSEYLWLCHMSHVYLKCLCWSLGHAEQLLFSCVSSKVSIFNYVTCHISHITCHIAHVTCYLSNAYLDPRDILNKFCFHVYAQKWVFVIMSHVACHMSHVLCQMLMLILGSFWTTFVFMCKLKSDYL